VPGTGNFEIVFVCTGNRFRSPLAEALMRSYTEELPVRTSSLGTMDVGTAPVLPEALALASQIDLDVSGHRACALAGRDLGDVDLVLGFERRHVGAAVAEAGAAAERSFALPELVGLLECLEPPADGDPVARARESVRQAHELRTQLDSDDWKEVVDPLGSEAQGYVDALEQVRDLCHRLAVRLFDVERAPSKLALKPVPRRSSPRRFWPRRRHA
jgi:protein-tyrosine phosphatase